MYLKPKIGLILFSIMVLAYGVFLFSSGSDADKGLSDEERRQKVEMLYETYKASFPEVEDISAEEALELMREKPVVFVDVRTPEEQAVSMLPQAITKEDFLKDPEAYKDHLVIGYCTISFRSGKLAEKLRKKGIHMVNLRGGILAWLHAGGKVYREGRPVEKVHVYGKKWDLAPSAYETVRFQSFWDGLL